MADVDVSVLLRVIDRYSGPMRRAQQQLRGFQGPLGARGAQQPRSTATPVAAGRTPKAPKTPVASPFAGGMLMPSLAITGGVLGFGAALRGTVGQARSFEVVMAEIEKKSSLSAAGLENMSRRIIALSNAMPIARDELGRLVAAAGQYGIANEDMERFALLGAKSAIAFDMTGEAAGRSLSEIKNAFDLDMKGLSVVADAINATADSAGASEQNLIQFLNLVGAAGNAQGISAQELIAFGASVREIGVSAPRAATAMNGILVKASGIMKNPKARKAFDAVAGKGYSQRIQQKFYETPVEALTEIFEMAKGLSKEQRTGLFVDWLGLEYVDDAEALSANIETIQRRLEGLRDPSTYVGSVSRAYEIQAATTDAAIKRLQNNWANIGAQMGAAVLPSIADFANGFSDRLTRLQESSDSVFHGISTAWSEMLAGMTENSDGAFDGLQSALATLDGIIFGTGEDAKNIENIKAVGAAFRELGEGMRALADGSIVTGLDKLTGVMGSFLDGVQALGPLGGGVALLAAAGGFTLLAGSLRLIARSGFARIFLVAGAIATLVGALRDVSSIGEAVDALGELSVIDWAMIAGGVGLVAAKFGLIGRTVRGATSAIKKFRGLFGAGAVVAAGAATAAATAGSTQDAPDGETGQKAKGKTNPVWDRLTKIAKVGGNLALNITALSSIFDLAKAFASKQSYLEHDPKFEELGSFFQNLTDKAHASREIKQQQITPLGFSVEQLRAAVLPNMIPAEATSTVPPPLEHGPPLPPRTPVPASKPSVQSEASIPAARPGVTADPIDTTAARQAAEEVEQTLTEAGRQGGENLRQGVSQGVQGAATEASTASERVAQAFDTLGPRLFQSGATAGSQFAAGIRSKQGEVSAAANALAEALARKFPQSPAKEGPLRLLPEMGAKIVSQLISGMRVGPAGEAAANIASAMSNALSFIPPVVGSPSSDIAFAFADRGVQAPQAQSQQGSVTNYVTNNFYIDSTDPRGAADEIMLALDARTYSALDDIGDAS
ncbi:MAG: phage tail tape measure protein [Devosia sp.]